MRGNLQSKLKKDSVLRVLWRQRYPQAFVLLGMAFLLVFSYSPMVGLLMAFKNYKITQGYMGIFTAEWVGFRWFVEFFTDYKFNQLLQNTLTISVMKLVFTFPIPLILAVMLYEAKNKIFKRTVQTASYLPYFISWVVVAGFCREFLARDGVLNDLLIFLRVTNEPLSILTAPEYFYTLAVISGIWKDMGWWAIIFLAAIVGVDPALYEAAVIDGAGRLQRIRHIMVPSILPTITVVFILAIGNLLGGGLGGSTFEQSLLLGNPSNNATSDILQTYSFRIGLSQGRYAFATAVGLIQSLVSVLLVFSSNAAAKKITGSSLF